jgi:hypothetical protein
MTRQEFNDQLETFSKDQLENLLNECIIADVIPENKYSDFESYDVPGLIQICHEEFPDEAIKVFVAEDVEGWKEL